MPILYLELNIGLNLFNTISIILMVYNFKKQGVDLSELNLIISLKHPISRKRVRYTFDVRFLIVVPVV